MGMKTTTLVFVCVAFAALACAEELKAETNVETDAKAKPFVSPFMGGMYPGMGGYGNGMGGYGGAGYGMGGMGMGGIWQYAPYLFAGYFDPYLFNAIFTPNMMYGNTMQALTGGKALGGLDGDASTPL